MELVRRRTWIFFDIRPTFIFLYRDERTPAKVIFSFIETKERLQR